MKCPKCGLNYEVTTTTSETGDISLRGIHVAGGVDCLTRQLAAKSAECERLREADRYTYEEYLRAFKPAEEETPPSDPAEFGRWLADKTIAIFQAALSRAEGKE